MDLDWVYLLEFCLNILVCIADTPLEFLLNADDSIIVVLALEIYQVCIFKFQEVEWNDWVNHFILSCCIDKTTLLFCVHG